MIILLDTNIVLELISDKVSFSDGAAKIFSLIKNKENKEINGFICARTVSYFLRK